MANFLCRYTYFLDSTDERLILNVDFCFQSKFAAQQERMLQQQQEKDSKMHSIIERLVRIHRSLSA